MQLVHKATRQPVQIGERIASFRGEFCTVESVEQPRHAGSTGRVYVRADAGWSQGFYPSVFDLEWQLDEVEQAAAERDAYVRAPGDNFGTEA